MSRLAAMGHCMLYSAINACTSGTWHHVAAPDSAPRSSRVDVHIPVGKQRASVRSVSHSVRNCAMSFSHSGS